MKFLQHPNQAEDIDWRAVYDELLPPVYYFFFYKVGDACLAEELAASTFEKAWKHRVKYNRRLGELRFYIFGIARNVAVDHFRRQRPNVQLDSADQLPDGANVEEQVERRMDQRRLARLVAALPERERDLISLKYGAGMTNREIARLTGLSESNVGTVLHRTVVKLREEWEPFE